MSTASRPSSYPDRRNNGSAGSGTSGRDAERPPAPKQPRNPTHETLKNEHAADPRYHRSQREGSPQSTLSGTSHKRSASGHVRPVSRTTEERHTEKTRITTRETIVSRAKSPVRGPPVQKDRSSKSSDGLKAKPVEVRGKERAEMPPQAPWNPEAVLLKHTTAPLASRISIPPLAAQAPQALQPKPLSVMSLEAQEAVLLEDLLFVFMGYEGQYIRFGKGYDPNEERDRLSGPTWRILPGLDPSLQDLTLSMLQMATHYSALKAFVDVQSQAEYGSVCHALCASMRKLLQDYLVLIAQLETQFLTNDSFTLHVLNIHILPTSQMMLQLYAVAHELLKKNALLDDESDDSGDDETDYDKIIDKLKEGGDLVPGSMAGKKTCKGGVVLGLIAKRLETMSGDPSARALLTTLLGDASRPYMAMLNEWLHHGAINDPHSEFLVEERKSINREMLEKDYTDDYWDKRYTIREKEVPPQLVGVLDKVLLAGKYLNVVRECGGVDVSKEVKDVPTTFDDNRFLDNVNNAYAHANESLMRLLLTTHSLPARLRSLKHYFFLDPSDYVSYFLELSHSELKKPVGSVNTGKLQSLLDLVLRQPGSIVSLDPFKEDVKVEMNESSLIKSLQNIVNIRGMEQGEVLQPSTTAANQAVEKDPNASGHTSLQLDYAVPFPVSLVISRRTIWRYQCLLRYLLSLRHLESQLSTGCWQLHNRAATWIHKSSERMVENWKRRIWTLRARMLVFVQQLLYFCTAEVIEPNWQSLMSRLKEKEGAGDGEKGGYIRTVDELMQDHVDFLDTCMKECMLTNYKLLKIHGKLMNSCTMFVTSTNWMTKELSRADSDLTGPDRPAGLTDKQWKEIEAIRGPSSSSSADPNLRADTSMVSEAGPTTSTSGSTAGDRETARITKMFELLEHWELNFSRHLQILLDALNHYAATETVVLLSLCARLSTANQGTKWAGPKTEQEMGI